VEKEEYAKRKVKNFVESRKEKMETHVFVLLAWCWIVCSFQQLFVVGMNKSKESCRLYSKV
jgi:hypothetical protein